MKKKNKKSNKKNKSNALVFLRVIKISFFGLMHAGLTSLLFKIKKLNHSVKFVNQFRKLLSGGKTPVITCNLHNLIMLENFVWRKTLIGMFGVLFGVIIFVSSSYCYAATIWCNPANTGVEDGNSKSTGYNTLHEALAVMAPNDIVIIANGDWSNTTGMYIDKTHRPPDGINNQYSKIYAETDWGVKLPYIHIETLPSEPHGYIEIRGIVFDNKFIGNGIGHIVYHMNHFKYIRCGFLAHGLTGNSHAAGFGNADSNRSLNQFNLMEECIVWGSGRYMLYSKYGQYNIFRRVVVRHDYHDGAGGQDDGQIFNFRAYACDYHIYQNCISIDSDRTQYFSSLQNEAGGYWVGDSYGATGNSIVGSISIKDVHLPYYIAGNGSGSAHIENSVALDVTVPGYTTLSAFMLKSNIDLTANNVLGVGALNAGQDGFYGKNNGFFTVTDSILRDVNEYGVNDAVTGTNINYYNAGTGNFGTGAIESDPYQNGLLYPVRIEGGSPLSTAGSNGGPIGPTILKKIGVSGTLYGEPGWDTATEENLWPFPNESEIKELMSTTVDGVNGIYGFTSGNSLDGTPQTLTKYIWEYLGNQIPCEIYNECNSSNQYRADVDNNSQINTTDAMLTLRNSLGLSMTNTNWQTSTTTGDVNCDGNSNSTDAMLILRYSLGLSMSGTGWCI